MKFKNKKTEKRSRLKAKIRSRVFGTAATPRLSVFKSNRFMYAQVIDDEKRVTLAAASDMTLKKGTKTERAKHVGELIATAAKAKGITKVVFDRNGFKYTGRVRALADEARAQGLIF
jgi:large subunit ribosomal protein L18